MLPTVSEPIANVAKLAQQKHAQQVVGVGFSQVMGVRWECWWRRKERRWGPPAGCRCARCRCRGFGPPGTPAGSGCNSWPSRGTSPPTANGKAQDGASSLPPMRHLSWRDFDRAVEQMAKTCAGLPISTIIGILRGGLVLAVDWWWKTCTNPAALWRSIDAARPLPMQMPITLPAAAGRPVPPAPPPPPRRPGDIPWVLVSPRSCVRAGGRRGPDGRPC